MIKKILAILIVVCFAVSGCSQGGSNAPSDSGGSDISSIAADTQTSAAKDDEITLKFLTMTNFVDYFTVALEEYKKIHPNITFVFEAYPFQEMLQVIQLKMSAGDSTYDVFSVDSPLTQNYAYRGFLLPMDDYLTPEDKKAIVPSTIRSMSYDGKIYSAPMATASQVIYYNKELFDQAGIPYLSSSIDDRLTWEQTVETSNELMEKLNPNRDNGIWAFAFQQIVSTYNVMPLVNSMGGYGVSDDGLKVEGIINSEPWIKAMKFYSDLFNTWRISPKEMDSNQIRSLFTSGKLAMMIGSVAIPQNNIQVDNPSLQWGYAPHPYFENGKVVTPTGTWHYGVNTATKYADECMSFIHWVSWEEGSSIILNTGYANVPCRYDQIEMLTNDTEGKYTGDKELYKLAVKEVTETAVPRPLTVGYSDWDSVMMTVFEDIRNGADVESSLNQAVIEIQPLLDKYNQ